MGSNVSKKFDWFGTNDWEDRKWPLRTILLISTDNEKASSVFYEHIEVFLVVWRSPSLVSFVKDAISISTRTKSDVKK